MTADAGEVLFRIGEASFQPSPEFSSPCPVETGFLLKAGMRYRLGMTVQDRTVMALGSYGERLPLAEALPLRAAGPMGMLM